MIKKFFFKYGEQLRHKEYILDCCEEYQKNIWKKIQISLETYINLYNELRIKIKFLLIDYKKFYLDHKNNKKIIMYIIKQIKQINKEIWRNKKMIVSIKKIWINKEKYFQKIRKKKRRRNKKINRSK